MQIKAGSTKNLSYFMWSWRKVPKRGPQNRRTSSSGIYYSALVNSCRALMPKALQVILVCVRWDEIAFCYHAWMSAVWMQHAEYCACCTEWSKVELPSAALEILALEAMPSHVFKDRVNEATEEGIYTVDSCYSWYRLLMEWKYSLQQKHC